MKSWVYRAKVLSPTCVQKLLIKFPNFSGLALSKAMTIIFIHFIFVSCNKLVRFKPHSTRGTLKTPLGLRNSLFKRNHSIYYTYMQYVEGLVWGSTFFIGRFWHGTLSTALHFEIAPFSSTLFLKDGGEYLLCRCRHSVPCLYFGN